MTLKSSQTFIIYLTKITMRTEDLHSLTKVLRGCCANSGVNTMLFQEDNNVLLGSAPAPARCTCAMTVTNWKRSEKRNGGSKKHKTSYANKTEWTGFGRF